MKCALKYYLLTVLAYKHLVLNNIKYCCKCAFAFVRVNAPLRASGSRLFASRLIHIIRNNSIYGNSFVDILTPTHADTSYFNRYMYIVSMSFQEFLLMVCAGGNKILYLCTKWVSVCARWIYYKPFCLISVLNYLMVVFVFVVMMSVCVY